MKFKLLKEIRKKTLKKSNSMLELEKDPITLKKEKEWDNRFIYNKILNYNSNSDRAFQKKGIFNNMLKSISFKNKRNNLNINDNFLKGNYTQKNFYNKPNLSIENNLNGKNKKENSFILDIKNLWSELNVLENYKDLFIVLSEQLNEIERENFFKNEIKHLYLIKEKINSLVSIIKKRENLIFKLKIINNDFSEEMNNSEKNNKLIKETIEIIQNLREITINLVKNMNNFRKEIYYYKGEKFDIEILGLKYGFDNNYLIKMKEELMFLKKGYMRFFFNFNNDNSPFLLNSSYENKNNNFMIKIPLDEKIKDEIEKCQFIIYQDLILYQNKNPDNNEFKDNNFSQNSLNQTYNKNFFKLKKNKIGSSSLNKDFYSNKEINSSSSFISSIKLNPIKKKINKLKFENKEEITKAFQNLLSGNKYKISFYKKPLNSFYNNHYKDYFQKIPEEQIKFFNLNQNIIKSFIIGISPCLILLKDNNKNLIGLSGLSYNYSQKNLTLNINHISTIDKENYKERIQSLLNYIKNKFYYDDLNINFSSEYNNEEIKQFLIEQNNFILEGENILKYNNLNKESNKVKKTSINLNKKIFSMSNSMIITNGSQNYLNSIKIKKGNEDDKYINLVTYNFLISENNPNSIISNLYSKVSKLNDLIKYFSNNNLNIKLIPISIAENTYNIKSCILNQSIFKNLNLFNSNKFSFQMENNIYYNYIKPPFTIYINSSKNYSFYQISNDNISLIIFEINNDLKDNLNNIYIQINELYKETLNENNKIIKDNCLLWIPCFEKNEHLKTNKITFSNLNNNLIVDEYIRIYNKKIIKDSKNEINHSGDIKKIPTLEIIPDNENDIIIKNNFMIGLVNQTIKQNENSDFPYIIFVSEIKKDNLINY